MLTLMIKHLDHDNADFGLGETVTNGRSFSVLVWDNILNVSKVALKYLNEKQSIVKYLCIFETVSLCRVSDFFPL